MGNRRERRRNAANGNKPQGPKGLEPVPPAGERAEVTPLSMLTELEARIVKQLDGMKPRFIQFARRLAEGVTQTQAAIDAGYSVSHAAAQGSRMAAEPEVTELVELLQAFSILTEAHISKPALRKVLLDVMTTGLPSDRVAATRAAMRLEGHDRIKVEVSGGVTVIDEDTLRREMIEKFARLQAQKEDK